MKAARAVMMDLFDTPILRGLHAVENFVSAAEEVELIAAIDATPLAPFRFQGWFGKRLTHSFGWHYHFDGGGLAATQPMPDWLTPLRARAERAFGLPDGELVQALVIRYDLGAGIGWHRDRPLFEHVVGISLGYPATMRFRRRAGEQFERRTVPLPPRGAYHLTGVARHEWEHSITEMDATRWSITFRSLSDKGRRTIAPA